MAGRFDAAIDALEKALGQSVALRTWLRTRRWCGDAIDARMQLLVKDRARLAEAEGEAVAFFLLVARDPNTSLPVHVPLAVSAAKPEPEAFELAAGPDRVYVSEGERRESYARFLTEGFRDRLTVRTANGDVLRFQGEAIGSFRSAEPFPDDSSNVLVRIATTAGAFAFKSYKLLDVENREPEILQRLHKKGFRHVPRYRGELALGKGSDRLVLGVVTDHVPAKDVFAFLTEGWRGEFAGGPSPEFEAGSLDLAARLGEATAALHAALVDGHPSPFQPEAFTAEDAEAATKAALTNLSDSLRRLAGLAKGPDERLRGLAADARMQVFERRDRIESVLLGLERGVGTAKAVTHGDLHLAQVLRTEPGDLLFLDFEGEPERAPGQRAAKLPPLRDVATMNRSFAYVKHYAWREATKGDGTAAWRFHTRDGWTAEEDAAALRLAAWESAAVERYTRAYLAHSAAYASLESDEALRAIRGWTMEKALYELRYELKHRPQNIFIPLEGVLSLAAESEGPA